MKKPAAHKIEGSGASVTYPDVKECPDCGKDLMPMPDTCTANVWNGGKWEKIVHGRKQCPGRRCRLSFRLNFKWSDGILCPT